VPELPEVETVRRDLQEHIVGATIVSAAVHGHRTVRRQKPDQFISAVSGRKLISTSRRGKYLFIEMDDGNRLAVHLRMSGQLLLRSNHHFDRIKHTHAILDLDSGASLHFVDPRTFGELWVSTASIPELDHVGPDALDELGTVIDLRRRLGTRRSGLKAILMNQAVLSGIGNIYSDEILFQARLRLTRTPESLNRPALARLHQAINNVLTEAVERRGSSLSDEQYVDLFGKVGTAQASHCVYAREGSPCVVCERKIERVKFAGRSSFYCRNCQR